MLRLRINCRNGPTMAILPRRSCELRNEWRNRKKAKMYDYLLSQNGPKCQGCDRTVDDPRYLELDHNTPRADGGINHISNRILLCGPCNRLKSNTFTLSGLRKQNQKLGY